MPDTLPIVESPALDADYSRLKQSVTSVLIRGQKRIEALKVEIYWQTGWLISTYLKEHPEQNRRGPPRPRRASLAKGGARGGGAALRRPWFEREHARSHHPVCRDLPGF